MSVAENFLSPEDEEEIVEAIRIAENKTSGEIRIHLEPSCGKNPLTRAKEIFHWLKMDNTKEGNGVLIYVAVKDHTFAVYGDEGINKLVPANFWDSTKEIMQSNFKLKKFKQGLIEGVLKAGEQLQKHFPWDHKDSDNQLSDEISKG